MLVDEHDRPVGTEEKLAAHRAGVLHRAVSVFVFDERGRTLLQRRAATKYHSAGRWSNACCGHPRSGEAPAVAAARRLREEMGLTCPCEGVGAFVYRADVGGGLVEHEYDHLFIARSSASPVPSPSEVDAWRWVDAADLRSARAASPHDYTPWFWLALDALLERRALPFG